MKTYLTFTKNDETFLRLENPCQRITEQKNDYNVLEMAISPAWDQFEQTALSEAKVLINPVDGKEVYTESELTQTYQMQDEETGIWGTVRCIAELVDDLDSPVREVWKYIGERNAYFKEVHGEIPVEKLAQDFHKACEILKNEIETHFAIERNRIIGIIEAEMYNNIGINRGIWNKKIDSILSKIKYNGK